MRVLVIADSRFVRETIQRSLRADAAVQVISCLDGGNSCREQVVAAQPDVVVFDEMAEPALALARIEEARAAARDAKFVLLTSRMQDAWLADAVQAGADAAVSKSVNPGGLATLIRAISSGAVYHRFLQPPPKPQPLPTNGGLTRRELEILQQVAEGASNGEIAARLCVTEQTVKFHLSNVYRKLGVANRTQASRYAHVHRLVGAPLSPQKPRAVPRAA